MSSQALEGLVRGLHHITLVTSSEMVNRRFYTEVLGLRRVKLTVNQDDVYHRHLFYADEKGSTGSAITFFEWPSLPQGQIGTGSPHHLSYTLEKIDAIPSWMSWLRSNDLSVAGPLMRDHRISLYLRDPDGVIVEITVPNEETVTPDYLKEATSDLPTVSEISSEMRLSRFNHASPLTTEANLTAKFFHHVLGLKNSFQIPNSDQEGTRITAIGNEERPDFLRYLTSPRAPHGFVGDGSIHHIAMAVEEDEDQLKLLKRMNEVGIANSGIIDRFWFKSLYFRDPHGNLLEIATKKPGYTIDEPPDKLGSHLVLPPQFESRRGEIEQHLKSLDETNPTKWPPRYPDVTSPPEAIPVIAEMQ